MYIIVGLGNPTREYSATRHNIGFDAITRIAEDNNISLDRKKQKALCGRGMIHGEKVVLAQPQTYMNLSGESVLELKNFYKADCKDIIVIYDDISLNPGQLRIRPQGSAGGHNGIKSIISHLGTECFPRIKIGIGDKPRGWDLKDYVLGYFKGDEKMVMQEAVMRASEACACIISEGVDAAMNQFNKKKQDE